MSCAGTVQHCSTISTSPASNVHACVTRIDVGQQRHYYTYLARKYACNACATLALDALMHVHTCTLAHIILHANLAIMHLHVRYIHVTHYSIHICIDLFTCTHAELYIYTVYTTTVRSASFRHRLHQCPMRSRICYSTNWIRIRQGCGIDLNRR